MNAVRAVRSVLQSRRMHLNIPSTPLAQFAGLAREVEHAGFDSLGVGDMQSAHREVYCSLTVAALSTTRAGIDPGVTIPATRHPAVAASAIATVHEARRRSNLLRHRHRRQRRA